MGYEGVNFMRCDWNAESTHTQELGFYIWLTTNELTVSLYVEADSRKLADWCVLIFKRSMLLWNIPVHNELMIIVPIVRTTIEGTMLAVDTILYLLHRNDIEKVLAGQTLFKMSERSQCTSGVCICFAWLLMQPEAPFTNRVLSIIPAWISNHMPRKLWHGITYPFLNFNGCTVEV